MKLFVVGEGVAEIGKWAEHPSYRSGSLRSNGVLFELFKKKRSGEVVNGIAWKNIKKFTANGASSAEQRILKKATVLAMDSDADVLLWSRDSDGYDHRNSELTEELERLNASDDVTVDVMGGVAEPCIEAWVVGLAKLNQSPESLSVPKLKALAQENELGTEQQMVDFVVGCSLDASLNPSLKDWLARL
jgi:hypothetical protein